MATRPRAAESRAGASAHDHSTVPVLITHSREQMQIAERIVVLDQGQVAEEGTFDELLAANGALTNLLSGGEWDGGAEMRNERRAARVRGGLRMRDVEWRGRRARNRMRL